MLITVYRTFTVWALVDPVPTKRREGAELLKFLFTDLRVLGRVFLNIRHPVESWGRCERRAGG
jgi:hypothetical protein